MPEITIRLEEPGDFRAVEELTRDAFWNHYGPGCVEHYLAHSLRDDPAFVRELDFVAEADGRLVGTIMYSRARIQKDFGGVLPVLLFGPVSVLPAWQGRGVGSKLIRASLARAKELGYQAILITGDPAFYARFGFRFAESFGIAMADGCYADALLALELEEGALSDCQGLFLEPSAFAVDPAKARAFDREFPPLERVSGGESQARFQELAGRRRPRK